jgi:sulfonate transport system ATP-binding protein
MNAPNQILAERPLQSTETVQTGAAARARTGMAVELSGVSKHYGTRRVLHDIDLRIEPGSFVAIAGRSGSGKTTLLRLIAGLEQPDGGTVTLDGAIPSTQKRAIRIMFQDGRLLPWRRVTQNITLGLSRADYPRAQAALDAVGLADRGHDWPRVLSGGQKQRVALARALAAQPRLILLDEPLGALDALTRLDMQRLIETIWLETGFTAVLVTHDVTEAAVMADRVIVVDEGRISLDETIPLARPRSPGPELAAVEGRILQRILAGA